MKNEPDYILDLGSNNQPDASSEKTDAKGRAYISVLFECCGVYSRIYKNREATAYDGWCPKCARKLNIKIGENGVNCRFFRAK